MSARFAWIIVFVTALGIDIAAAAPVRIGSKTFTESVVLGEILRLEAQRQGMDAEHRRALGGTRILWRALSEGEIDIYPEYTGTIVQELVRDLPADADDARLRAALAPLGIGISAALGFDDSYALGMREEVAARLGIQRISDLSRHAELRYGWSNEFMDRQDGWPGLQRTYGLAQVSARGMSHELAYRALLDDAIDVLDLYTTDPEIRRYRLRVLADDRRYFPLYRAVLLYRLDREPVLRPLLDKLAGHIGIDDMRGMNAAVAIDKRSETEVAAAFLGVAADGEEHRLWRRLAQRTLEHLELVAISLGLAIAVAVPLGIFAARRRRLGALVTAATGILQTVPSLAMFVFMIPLFGIGWAPAVAALFLYSLLPIVRNTQAGLTGIAPELLESAAALGLPQSVRLRHVELPLALRSILAGIKTAAVINVGTATLGALIGAGGYGEPILTGIRLDDLGLILEGALPAALMALAVQGLFEGAERLLTPRGLRIAHRE